MTLHTNGFHDDDDDDRDSIVPSLLVVLSRSPCVQATNNSLLEVWNGMATVARRGVGVESDSRANRKSGYSRVQN